MIWTATRVERHGIPLLLFARFVPGGRTAGALTAGFVRFPQRRFALAATVGAALWSTVNGTLGFLGGRLTADPLVGFALAAGVALLVGAAAHLAARAGTRKSSVVGRTVLGDLMPGRFETTQPPQIAS